MAIVNPENSLLGKDYSDRLIQVQQLLENAVATVKGVHNVLMTQVLENSDQIIERSKKGNGYSGMSEGDMQLLVETMIKSPIRKHSARLKASTISIEESLRQINRLLNNNNQKTEG